MPIKGTGKVGLPLLTLLHVKNEKVLSLLSSCLEAPKKNFPPTELRQ